MATTLIIFNSTSAAQICAAYISQKFSNNYGTPSLQDIAGVSTSNVSAMIAGLTAGAYDRIFIPATVTTAAAGVITRDQIAALTPALTTAALASVTTRTGTCQTNTTVTEIVLDAGASTINDFYKGQYITTAGTTVVSRYITAYNGTSKRCTVLTTTTAITTTETFTICNLAAITHIYGIQTGVGANSAVQAWQDCYPNISVPMWVYYCDGVYNYIVDSGQAESATANTLVVQSANTLGTLITNTLKTTDNFLNGMWVYIVNSTLGKGSWAKIIGYIGSSKTAIISNTISVQGACATNATATSIIITGSNISKIDDHYNGMYVVTDGVTKKTRLITDYSYNSSTKQGTLTVDSTSTAITNTETYIIYNITLPAWQSSTFSGTTATPTETIIYRIVASQDLMYMDIAAQLYSLTYLINPALPQNQNLFDKLVDYYGTLNGMNEGTSVTDFNTLNAIKAGGIDILYSKNIQVVLPSA